MNFISYSKLDTFNQKRNVIIIYLTAIYLMLIPLYTLATQMNAGEITSIYPLIGLGIIFLILLQNTTFSRYMILMGVMITFIYRILDIIFPHYGCFTQHYFSLVGGFRDYEFIAFDGTFMWESYLLALLSFLLITVVHLYTLFLFYSKEGLSLYGLKVQNKQKEIIIFLGIALLVNMWIFYPVVEQVLFSKKEYIPPII